MPFLAHFGLKDHPFTLTPNVEYFFPSHEHANIINSLDFALRRETGIIKVVGEIGTGKTLLCRLLIKQLVEQEAVAYINAPQASEELIVNMVCHELGVSTTPGESPYVALNRFLVEQHEKGRLVVVVVDEAQALGKEGLEAIRLLSNLETERSKLLQIVLFGQSELDVLLADPALRQLNQRIVFSFYTKPLSEAETKRYIVHRIKKSRREGIDYEIFQPAALELIAKHSGGTPRVTNILADKSLLVAFSEGSPMVTARHAEEAINDSPGLVKPVPFYRRTANRWMLPAAAAAGVALLLILAGLGIALLRGGEPTPTAATSAPVPATVAAPTPVAPAPAPKPAVAAPKPAPAPVAPAVVQPAAPAPAAAPAAAAPQPVPAAPIAVAPATTVKPAEKPKKAAERKAEPAPKVTAAPASKPATVDVTTVKFPPAETAQPQAAATPAERKAEPLPPEADAPPPPTAAPQPAVHLSPAAAGSMKYP